MLAHRRRDADPARLGKRLQPRRDIDRVTEEIAIPGHHIADMEADAELDAAMRRKVLPLLQHRALHRDRADEPAGDAGKLG